MPKGTPLRSLLPAIGGTRTRSPVAPAKKARVLLACSACKDRKTKCSNERPQCAECLRRSTPCEYTDTRKEALYQRYEDLRKQQNAYEKLLNQLITLPESESLDVLRRIKAGNQAGLLPFRPSHSQTDRDTSEANMREVRNNVLKRKHEQLEQRSRTTTDLYGLLQHTSADGADELLRHIRQGMSPDDVPALTGQLLSRRSPSLNQTNRSIMPPTDTSIESELISLHPNAYPALIPLDVASIDLGLLEISPFTSFVYGKSNLSSRGSKKGVSSEHNQLLLLTPSSASNADSHFVDTNPVPSGQYIDARLNRIHIRRWTDVAITDDLAAQVINLYLINDTPWWAFFNIDLFLDDLANDGTRFCSQLLVNSLLAWACQVYAYFEPAAFPLARRFLHEASQLYDAVKDVDCLTTVASTSLLCLSWTTFGRDKLGMTFLAKSAGMAERLHLYNVVANPLPSLLNLDNDDIRTAAAATAWGSFNFQMIMSMSYRREPLVKIPPRLPIPGDSSIDGLIDRPLPPYQGEVYTCVCKFWLIAFEMNYQYFHQGVVSLPDAECIFQRLLAWADNLQEGTKRGQDTPDGVSNLHMWFHTTVMDLFRPFADLDPQPKLTTFAEDNATPAKVVEASVKQLKRLIYTYRATSQSANYSIIWQSGMLYLINHILHNFTDNEAHFYFLLCMRGYQNLARTIPFIGGVVQSVAAVAVRRGTILPEDAFKLFEEIESEGERIHEYMSTYPVDLYPSMADPDTATLENLVHDFRNMVHLEPRKSDAPKGWKGSNMALFTTLLEEEQGEGGGDSLDADELPSQ